MPEPTSKCLPQHDELALVLEVWEVIMCLLHRTGGLPSKSLASVSGNLNAVELDCEQYTLPEYLYSMRVSPPTVITLTSLPACKLVPILASSNVHSGQQLHAAGSMPPIILCDGTHRKEVRGCANFFPVGTCALLLLLAK